MSWQDKQYSDIKFEEIASFTKQPLAAVQAKFNGKPIEFILKKAQIGNDLNFHAALLKQMDVRSVLEEKRVEVQNKDQKISGLQSDLEEKIEQITTLSASVADLTDTIAQKIKIISSLEKQLAQSASIIKAAQKDFATKYIVSEVDHELKHMGIEAFQELFGSDYSEDILK